MRVECVCVADSSTLDVWAVTKKTQDQTGTGLEMDQNFYWFFAPFYQPSSLLLYRWLIQGLKFSVWEHFVGTQSVYPPVKPYIKGIKYTIYSTHNSSCTVYMSHYDNFIAATQVEVCLFIYKLYS